MIIGENPYWGIDKFIRYTFRTFSISFLYCGIYVTGLTSKHENEDGYNSNILEKIWIFIMR